MLIIEPHTNCLVFFFFFYVSNILRYQYTVRMYITVVPGALNVICFYLFTSIVSILRLATIPKGAHENGHYMHDDIAVNI